MLGLNCGMFGVTDAGKLQSLVPDNSPRDDTRFVSLRWPMASGRGLPLNWGHSEGGLSHGSAERGAPPYELRWPAGARARSSAANDI